MPTESHLQKQCIAAAKKSGAWAIKVKAVGRRGMPDLIVIFPGGVVAFVELKTPTGVLSKLQIVFIRLLKKFGANAYVCASIGEFNAVLQRHHREPAQAD